MREAVEFYNYPDAKCYGRGAPYISRPVLELLIHRYLGNSPEKRLVALGSGKGALSNCHPNYLALDISHLALKTWLRGRRTVQANIQSVPLKDRTADLVFSRCVLEHLPRPEACLEEIDRILKPGGVLLLGPAWFCRPWAASGLKIKSFRQLSWNQRLMKISIFIRDSLLWRASLILPQRLFREADLALRPRPVPFRYKKLTPNLEEHLTPDSDAMASMDPHMALLYFTSRGYRTLRKSGFWFRLLFKDRFVIVRKGGHPEGTEPGRA
ncbi:MAG: class I SAM-dependent methyltransferase [Candidatus Binatia bacterium]